LAAHGVPGSGRCSHSFDSPFGASFPHHNGWGKTSPGGLGGAKIKTVILASNDRVQTKGKAYNDQKSSPWRNGSLSVRIGNIGPSTSMRRTQINKDCSNGSLMPAEKASYHRLLHKQSGAKGGNVPVTFPVLFRQELRRRYRLWKHRSRHQAALTSHTWFSRIGNANGSGASVLEV